MLGVVFLLVARWNRFKALQEHRRLTRRVVGCIECGKEVLYPDRLQACCTCPFECFLCSACVPISTKHLGHTLVEEPLHLEVDASSLAGSATVGEVTKRLVTWISTTHHRSLSGPATCIKIVLFSVTGLLLTGFQQPTSDGYRTVRSCDAAAVSSRSYALVG